MNQQWSVTVYQELSNGEKLYQLFSQDVNRLRPNGEWGVIQGTENAQRLIACVNGCAGLNPAAFREVVEALERAKIVIDAIAPWFSDHPELPKTIDTALARAEGRPA